MESIWRNFYPEGISAVINPDRLPSVTALCEEAMQTYADLPAFISFGHTLTYADVDRKSAAMAAFFQKKMGVKKGDRVAVMLPNVFAFPLALLGLIRIGAVQVNVNPYYTPRELRHQLNDAGVDTIVIFKGSTPVLAEIIEETSVSHVVVADLKDGGAGEAELTEVDARLKDVVSLADALKEFDGADYDKADVTGDDLIFLQYTGGTTGLSKGASLSHRNVLANSEQLKSFLHEAMRPTEEVVITAIPLYHIFALTVNFLTYFSIGSRNYLYATPQDIQGLIDILRDSRFSILTGVNTLYDALSMNPRIKEVDFSNYRLGIGGGSAVVPASSERWKKVSGHHIKEGYGLSETAPALAANPIAWPDFSGTVGLPMPSTEISILRDDDTEAGIGEEGEVCARGPQVMRGYWNRDDANAEVFTKDGFFRTGDIGLITEEGRLKIVDRKKDMVLVSGFNVFPNEIEAVVAALDGVIESACIGVPDERTGEALRLFVAKVPGSELTEEDVVAHCRKELTAYKVPRQIRFIDALPKSSVGKILRRELRSK